VGEIATPQRDYGLAKETVAKTSLCTGFGMEETMSKPKAAAQWPAAATKRPDPVGAFSIGHPVSRVDSCLSHTLGAASLDRNGVLEDHTGSPNRAVFVRSSIQGQMYLIGWEEPFSPGERPATTVKRD
jgi:hypothetical protein